MIELSEDNLSELHKEKLLTVNSLQQLEAENKELTRELNSRTQQFEEYRVSAIEEREELKKEISVSRDSAQAYTSRLQNDAKQLQSQLTQHEEEKRKLTVQLVKAQGGLSKTQQLYANILNEKSKIQGSEMGYRKQLISLTTTIDTLAEEKDTLLETISTLKQEKSALFRETQQAKLSSDNALEGLQFSLEQEKSAQKQLQDLKSVLTQKDSCLTQSHSESLCLTEKFNSLRSQFETLQLAADKTPEHCRIQELLTENSRLSFEVQKYQSRETPELSHENSELHSELKTLQAELAILQQSKDQALSTQAQQHEKASFALKQALSSLQEDFFALQPALQQFKQETFILHEERTKQEALISSLHADLEECQAEALNSRQEVSKVCTEIDNYAGILEAMEGKLLEAEERVTRSELEKEEALAEVRAVRQRYINIISS